MKKGLIIFLTISCSIIICNNIKAKSAGESSIDIQSRESFLSTSIDAGVRSAVWKFDSLSISRRVHIDNDTLKDGMMINLKLVYPVSVPESLNLKEVQNVFSCFFLGDKSFTGTPEEAFEKQLNAYIAEAELYAEVFKKEENGPYETLSNFVESEYCSIAANTEYLITIYHSSDFYTGGAHGGFGVNYLNIDKRDGTTIAESQLFKSGYESELALLIQDVIIQRNSSPDEDEHIGLLVDIETVKPNRNFLFSDEGLTYIYNIYEITPYVQGIVEIVIPYVQLIPLIDERYFPVVQSFK